MTAAAALALALVVASSTGAVPPGDRAPAGTVHSGAVQEEPREAVKRELEAYYRDFSARDWEAFADHFWPGARLATIWRPEGEDRERVVFTSVPEFVEQAPEGPGSKEIFEERMLSVEIRVSGPVAQAWARYRARFGDPGAVQEWEGIDAFTLLRHDGRWRITSLAYAAD